MTLENETAARLLSVHVGRVAPLGPDHVLSGFVKTAQTGPVKVGLLGLEGDAQADLSVHGGPEKAVYGYAVAHYAAWRADFPEHDALFAGGGMGENLSIDGLTEAMLCVGDVHAIGSAVLQVCQPRQPCFKLSLRYGDNRLPRAMIRSGRSGWYYRVLERGEIGAGDAVVLRDRPNPDFNFARLVEITSHHNPTVPELERLAQMPGLASQWQASAREALQEIRG